MRLYIDDKFIGDLDRNVYLRVPEDTGSIFVVYSYWFNDHSTRIIYKCYSTELYSASVEVEDNSIHIKAEDVLESFEKWSIDTYGYVALSILEPLLPEKWHILL